jgi:predicted LPLAT superfamily acyltransferase
LLVLAQSGNVPDDVGEAIVWFAVLGVMVGLYLLLRSTRRRADRQYWEMRRQYDEELRRNDPDLRKPEDD